MSHDLNPKEERWRGVARTSAGDFPFDVPFMSRVPTSITGPTQILWHGGVARGMLLPDGISTVVSMAGMRNLYFSKSSQAVTAQYVFDMEDDDHPPLKSDIDLAVVVALSGLDRGQSHETLVHCQAGLNRSSLVVGALIVAITGMSSEEAVMTMRDYRSPSVLCNPVFHDWFLEQKWTHGPSPS